VQPAVYWPEVRAYIDAHILGRMPVSELSAIVQLSPTHFSRCFKQTLGVSPHAFVMRHRLELAARLMLESTESLANIAHDCGFTDQPHFCRQFKRVMGESPAAWRRAQQVPRVGSGCLMGTGMSHDLASHSAGRVAPLNDLAVARSSD
jgi:AraC-like DNA-binding protein